MKNWGNIFYRFKQKALFLLMSLIIMSNTYAQEFSKIGFELKSYLKESHPNSMVPLLVEGSFNGFEEVVSKHEGNIRLKVSNLFSIEIPAKNVIAFSLEEAVHLIEFDTQPGHALNDTMLINTNVDSIIQAITPISKPFTGKGVLLGVIDSGIDIVHGDFKDSTGKTRIINIWEQGVSYNPSRKPGTYSYGQEWDSTDINSGVCTHDDDPGEFGHGSMVTGAAASNANETGHYRGVAPEVSIISVATDFNKINWLQTVAEAVDYIFKKADTLGMPCVINASVGTYKGSHDGKDIAARMIDLLIKQKSGRAFVCAAGNAGHLNFHLQQKPQNDTVFTWLEQHPAMFSGLGGIYFEAWSDTNDFSQMQFAIGADRSVGNTFEFRGRTGFTGISNKVNLVTRDSVMSLSGNKLAYVDYYVEQSQGRYKLEIAIVNPDSSNYNYRLETAGTGKLDIWSNFGLFRSSDITATGLPTVGQYPAIANYQRPDSLQTIVSSFTCLPSAITVGNYINRNTYIDFNGNVQNMGATPGEISNFSSLGPNRLTYLKPDISSAGDFMMSSGRIATMLQLQVVEPQKISQDGMHMRNGGTSMASPTVAGMVALYLEMCKTANYLDIKNKLLASAKTDAFTLNVPNSKWGVGKADAYQFLSSSAYIPNLNYGSTNFCDVDSISLGTLIPYSNYVWNTGDTLNNLSVNTNGTYFATVTNNLGCEAKTNEATFNFYNSPVQPIISRSNDTLSISPLGNYQWYRNNTIINGANNSTLKAIQSGDYFCEFTNTNTGCFANSDTVNVVITKLDEFNKESLSIYPNPSNGIISISGLKENQIYQLEVFNTSGQQVYSKTFSQKSKGQNINLKHLPKGIYLLKIQSDKSFINKSIMIQ